MTFEPLERWAERELGAAEDQAKARNPQVETMGCADWRYVAVGREVYVAPYTINENEAVCPAIKVAELPSGLHAIGIPQLDDSMAWVVTDDPDDEEFLYLLGQYNKELQGLLFQGKAEASIGWKEDGRLMGFRVQSAIFDSSQMMEIAILSSSEAAVKKFEDAMRAIRNFVAAHAPDPQS